MTDAQPALKASDVTKAFGGTVVLNSVSLALRAGSIHGLLGQNGAGKSTLVKIITGVYGHSSFTGTLRVGGRPVQLDRPHDARQLGIGYVPQEIDVVEHLTVTENVLAGNLGHGAHFSRRAADERCQSVLARLGVTISPRTKVSSLSAANRQLLMIARALALDPTVLLLDEPTTSLADTEAEALGQILMSLRDGGLGILYISHRVREVRAICDEATVLRDGRVVEHLTAGNLSSERIVTAMAGREVRDLFPGRDYQPQPVVLSVRDVSVAPMSGSTARVSGASFDVRRGEILGIAGLLGAGRTELLSGIFGAVGRTGTVSVNGKLVRPGHPRYARAAGIGMLTEERKRAGLLFNMNAMQNITLGSLLSVSRRGFLSSAEERRTSRQSIQDLEVKTPSLHSSVEHLSGGNQQKLLIGRVLLPQPSVILLDEPTKGVDVGTRQQIYRLIGELADSGAALIVVSSELDELLGMSDRVVVLGAGRLVDEFAKGEGDEKRILAAATLAMDEGQVA
jgi:ribose transport system ATP-binding protein/D-xylose transport system ATP-binding protein